MTPGFPFWAWMAAGLVLSFLGTLVPGAFLIFIGLAALVIGAIDFLWPLSLEIQALGFAALAATLALVGKRVYGSVVILRDSGGVGRAEALVGGEYYLDAGISRGFGQIRVADSVWRVSGPELPAGAKVKVIGVANRGCLRVDRV